MKPDSTLWVSSFLHLVITNLLLLNNSSQNLAAYYPTVSLGQALGSGLSGCFWLRVFDKVLITALTRDFIISMLKWGNPQPRPLTQDPLFLAGLGSFLALVGKRLNIKMNSTRIYL